MMLVYYEGKGLWLDFPSVDSPKRNNAYRKWVAENIPDTSEGDRNEDDWEKFSTKLAEWNKSNPPPKYKVIEDEISLEREHLFDLSTPVLSYQPEEAFVSAVFKLKAKDERRLRYKGEVTVSTLLPCDHPDGDRSGFFFQLDAPKTFTREDIVLDEPEKPTNKRTIESDDKMNNPQDVVDKKQVVAINSDLDYVDVFFKGYGIWTSDIYLIEESSGEPTIHIPIGQQINESSVCGVFVLGHTDTIAFKHRESLDDVYTLFPCTTHSNRAFPPEIDWRRIQKIGTLGVDLFVDVYFSIDRKRPERPIIAKPDNPTNFLAIKNNGADSQEATEPVIVKSSNSRKNQKKLIPLERNTTDLLELIYKMLDFFDVKVGDELNKLTAISAWGKIISKKYENELIESVSGERKAASFKLNGGTQVNFETFKRTYDRRFE